MGWNYIIGVRHTLDKELKTKFHLDSLIKWEDVDPNKLEYAKSLIENKLLKTNQWEAMTIAGLEIPRNLSMELKGLSLRVRSNNDITLHKFHTEDYMDDEDLAGYVETAGIVDSTRKKLMDARISL